MITWYRPIAISVAAALWACERPNQPEVDAAVAGFINAVVADARQDYGPTAGRGPVLIDLPSFIARGKVFSPEPRMGGRGSLPNGVLAVREKDAIRCSNVPPRCRVSKDGLYIRLDSLRMVGSDLEAVVTYAWTDRRPSGRSAIGYAQTRLGLQSSGAGWQVKRRNLIWVT